jgi:hypothetical protein
MRDRECERKRNGCGHAAGVPDGRQEDRRCQVPFSGSRASLRRADGGSPQA